MISSVHKKRTEDIFMENKTTKNTEIEKGNRTELVFVLDRSGSMHGLEEDTIGGFNSMLEKQKAEEGEATVTTVLFDSTAEIIHDRIDINAVPPLTEEEYYTGGCTALLDAIGSTIHKTVNAQKNSLPGYRADRVIFVITTDGMENASTEYNYPLVKKMIEKEQEKYGWEFIFLGANIDAAEEAENIGIRRNRAANYHADAEGTKLNYDTVCCCISNYRKTGELDIDCLADIEKDYIRRKKKNRR